MATMATTEARDRLANLLGRAVYAHERTTITRNGRPIAAIVPLDDLEAMEALEDDMDVREARKRLREERLHGVSSSSPARMTLTSHRCNPQTTYFEHTR